MRNRILSAALGCAVSLGAQQPSPPSNPLFTWQEVMIPARDGVHLQTAIVRPANQKGPLPILFTRTPYGVPGSGVATLTTMPPSFKELVQDGYIFVFQNLRGRFKSEGTFRIFAPPRDLSNPKSTDETTDAYDSIDWLVKNVPNNNGQAGIYGVSYDGLIAPMTLP